MPERPSSKHAFREGIGQGISQAIEQGDLESASAGIRALQTELSTLSEPELRALKSQLLQCREQALALRETCAAELRDSLRGRRKVNAYRHGSALVGSGART